jgi:glycerol-1-phosphate dehydrogenase [NAD(P)+]
MIADLFGTEPIRQDAWSVIHDMLPEVLADAQGIADRTPKAVENVFAGLTLSGVAMQIANDTRPLSCAEHLFSHYLDMTHHTFEDRMVLHGFQVSVGTVTMCAFFDELLKMDLTKLDVDARVAAWPTKESEVARATNLFSTFPVPELGPTEIGRKWQSPEEVREQLNRVKATWPEFREKLRNHVYSFEKMRDLFVTAGAPVAPEQIGVSREQWKNMTNYVQLMRWRVNLFDLAKRAQIFDTLVGNVFGKGGALEI